jgi:hypothetical protein
MRTTRKPNMTRVHFEFIADTIKSLSLTQEDVRHVAEAFARELGNTNPNFDRERFLNRVNS